jgi:DNA-binding HxlR family transcriptional regulator
MAGFDLRQAQEYAFTELGCTLDDPVGALLAWTAANTGAVRRSQAEFDRSHRMDDAA